MDQTNHNKVTGSQQTVANFEHENFLHQQIDAILNITNSDLTHENANMNALSPAGQMMNIASFITKQYSLQQLISPEFSVAHQEGYIHIHDMDYYPSKTTTCLQYDLQKLFTGGFDSEKGFIREPQTISAYASLAAIVFQTNQNEQHGGQAIPAFDYFMAPGVLKSFRKHLYKNGTLYLALEGREQLCDNFSPAILDDIIQSIKQDLNTTDWLCKALSADRVTINQLWATSYEQTTRETFQAMESFIHNLNTMHSRGGNQVVFSSINYGTDTSPEGRMVIKQLLLATQKGLGHGETPIFPIQIFKVKDGISYSATDLQSITNYHGDWKEGTWNFEAPNFDLLIEACITNTTRLFPNFVFLDAPFNQNEAWDHKKPDNYLHEIATMGCRTRVFEDIHGPKSSVGRGNLSFTSINLPRLAIEAVQEVNSQHQSNLSAKELQHLTIEKFYEKVEKYADLVARQLVERYQYQISANKQQYSFMLKNHLWNYDKDFVDLQNLDTAWKHGTLGIGFIGGHNAMVALCGSGHGHNDLAQSTLLQTIEKMNTVAEKYKQQYALNFSIIATPAEGLSGRFTKMDQKRFGIIAGVNDREYYVNSFHVDINEAITIYDKIRREAPFHALTLGGHITYVELDSNLKFNIPAILKIIQMMHDAHIGYGSINHPVDTCLQCHYTGVIGGDCAVCGGSQIRRIRRITGYLTGSLESWNSAKKAEERDRVKHGYHQNDR